MSAVENHRVRPTWAGEVERLHELLVAQATRTATEPSASASIETTAKGEPKPDVKVYATMGCDYDALAEHVRRVTDEAVASYGRAVAALAKIAGDEGRQL